MTTTATIPTEAPTALDYKILDPGAVEVLDLDEEKGQVRAIVAATGNVDDGGDLIEPGAFVFERTPKIVWAHDLKTLVGRVESWEEWLPGDDRLPEDFLQKGMGALVFDTQFDLTDPDGFRAFRKVVFHKDLGWSIGYTALDVAEDSVADRRLKSLVVWEASPLAFGMNAAARTLSVKDALGQALPAAVPDDRKTMADQIAVALAARDQEIEEADQDAQDAQEGEKALAGSLEGRQAAVRAEIDALAAWGDVEDVEVVGTYPDSVVVKVGDAHHRLGLDEDGALTDEVTDVEILATEKGLTATEKAEEPPAVPEDPEALSDAEKALLVDHLGEEKAGRVLASRNVTRIRSALDAITAVLEEATPPEEDDGKDLPPPVEVKARVTAADLDALGPETLAALLD